jgi:branched-chain amino acid aminotransferase/4-amino-4-deoxychorismate lyase
MKIVFNNALLRQDELTLPLNDRAFCYGDGLFETLIYRNGQLAYWPEHFQRMGRGMTALSMKAPEGFTAQELENQIRALLSYQPGSMAYRVRIQVWRQPGGLYTPASAEVNYVISTQPCTPPEVTFKERAFFYDAVPLSFSAISAFKNCNALPYVLAAIAKTRAEADDMILLEVNGNVAECIASNLFWMKENTVFTPSLESGCIDGVMRKMLIQGLRAAGYAMEEGLFSKETLLQADCVFCCNVAGLQFIEQVEQVRFPNPKRDSLEKQLKSCISLSDRV